MNKTGQSLRRCLFLLLLVLMVASDGIAQRFEPRIVFTSNRDGDWDIYSMDVNGDNLLQLTDHPASDEYPACSPDGRRIAFTSERGVTHDLYVMDSDGDNVIRLTHDNFIESRPSWSPDGTRITFGVFRFFDGNSEIYAMDADGNNLTRLAKHKWHDVVPSWSPDGRKIAFSSRRLFRDGQRDDIFVMTADGKELEQLTKDGRSRSPVYSQDGTKIAFVLGGRIGDANIFLMDTNGRNVVKLTRTPPGIDNVNPSWLPLGAFAVNPNGKLPISWGVLKRPRNP